MWAACFGGACFRYVSALVEGESLQFDGRIMQRELI